MWGILFTSAIGVHLNYVVSVTDEEHSPKVSHFPLAGVMYARVSGVMRYVCSSSCMYYVHFVGHGGSVKRAPTSLRGSGR